MRTLRRNAASAHSADCGADCGHRASNQHPAWLARVLVTSWTPLTVWFYQSAYVRMCAEEYRAGGFDSVFVHLTNHSISKKSSRFASGAQTNVHHASRQRSLPLLLGAHLWRPNELRGDQHDADPALAVYEWQPARNENTGVCTGDATGQGNMWTAEQLAAWLAGSHGVEWSDIRERMKEQVLATASHAHCPWRGLTPHRAPAERRA